MGTTERKTGGVWALGWWLYRAAVGAALLLAGPFLLLRRGAHYLPTLRGRLGWAGGERARRAGLWIHAVSVGEVGVAATLARELPADQPALVTTVTPTGQARARAVFRGQAAVAYLPFDLAGPVRRLFERHAPGALVLVEGDYWPLVLREAARRRLPVAVVNGRLGDRSFRRLKRLRALPGPFGGLGRRLLGVLFDPIARFGVQTDDDRTRLLALGVEPERVRVTGNLKYDTRTPTTNPELESAVRRLAGGRAVLVAGSTMAGEESRVLEALARLNAATPSQAVTRTGTRAGQEPASEGRALLVLAPRHPERWDAVAAEVTRAGLSMVRRSALDPIDATDPTAATEPDGPDELADPARRAGPGTPDVLLLDSLGELAGLYRLATAAFIGGTLVETGGHNPLEAACWGTPVVVGPSMENFRQIADEFDRHEAWARVRDAEDLAAAWSRWIDDRDAAERIGARGRDLIEANRGALTETLAMLSELVQALSPHRRE